MALEDKEKMMFITLWGTLCYKVMPFGLKNAGATYQRAIVTLFHDLMHKEIEGYMDDMIVKSRGEGNNMENLEKLLRRLLKCQLKLNPKKCTFGATSGMLLGFIVSEKGIEVDLDKIKAIQEMPTPKTEKEVQSFLVLASVSPVGVQHQIIMDLERLGMELVEGNRQAFITSLVVQPTLWERIRITLTKDAELAEIVSGIQDGLNVDFNVSDDGTDGQLKRTIHILEDMLWAFVLDFRGNWIKYLPLVEFAYNNSYQASIEIAQYEALYGRSYKSLELDDTLAYEEIPVQIQDYKEQELCTKRISFVKVLWHNHAVEEASWELEVEIR
ncbi:uncharacterized protein LOC131166753 [Malania oleifera]|uniref:uncharacterized protein LOC131166753 n=1 Tax=Malania oleifera TaxID=397392 RepID=UPI0025AEB547|nr:uncharacterized protein LOC131166753 [Malania oleifera]